MGLDYLNKKIWHPGSMKNIQKVWEVEQQQHEMNKRIKERAKKLMEERHNDELKRIQVEAGLIPRSHLDRMDWMYDWGNKVQHTAEEYLAPKKKEEKHVFQQEMTNKKCEDFMLLYQDPLFEIQRQQKARKDALLSNPVQMRAIIREIDLDYRPKERSRNKNQSTLYQQYLKDRFPGLLKPDEEGNLRPDYSLHRSKYRTAMQEEEDQKRRRRDKLRDNASKLQELKDKLKGEDYTGKEEEAPYEEGVAKLRGELLVHVKKNRNHRKYKEESD